MPAPRASASRSAIAARAISPRTMPFRAAACCAASSSLVTIVSVSRRDLG